jgi:hypothetical protein
MLVFPKKLTENGVFTIAEADKPITTLVANRENLKRIWLAALDKITILFTQPFAPVSGVFKLRAKRRWPPPQPKINIYNNCTYK